MEFYLSLSEREEKKLKRRRSLCYKFIWQRPISSFHRVDRREGDLLARQLNTFDAVLSRSIMAVRADTQHTALAPKQTVFNVDRTDWTLTGVHRIDCMCMQKSQLDAQLRNSFGAARTFPSSPLASSFSEKTSLVFVFGARILFVSWGGGRRIFMDEIVVRGDGGGDVKTGTMAEVYDWRRLGLGGDEQ